MMNDNSASSHNSNSNINLITLSKREPIETMLRKTNSDFKKMQDSLFQSIQNLDNENVYIILMNVAFASQCSRGKRKASARTENCSCGK